MGLDVRIAEIIGGTAQRNDQAIIVDVPDRGIDDPGIRVYPAHFGNADIDIFRMLEDLPQGEGYTGGLQARRGYLVHQGLELVVIMLVDEEDFVIRAVERPSQAETAKTRSDDDDPL